MNETQFREIEKKLDLIVKLLATQIIHDKDFRDQIRLLDGIGLPAKEIAYITGKTANNVRVTLHLLKRKKGSKKKGNKGRHQNE